MGVFIFCGEEWYAWSNVRDKEFSLGYVLFEMLVGYNVMTQIVPS